MTQLQCSFIDAEFGDFVRKLSPRDSELRTDWSPKGACTHKHAILGFLHDGYSQQELLRVRAKSASEMAACSSMPRRQCRDTAHAKWATDTQHD